MVPSDDLYEMLAEWEQARRQGRDIPPEELCRNRPELLDNLREAISALKATDWMDRVAASPAIPLNSVPNLCRVLGDYALLGKIGGGGMGEVYRAVHRRMDRVVALKVLPPSFAASAEAVQRFQAEVKAAARLIHPHVVTAFDAGQEGDTHWLAMELVEGTDLAGIVQEHGPLSLQQAVDYAVQAADGLEYAHRQGIVHRDIKPGNLILSKDGVVKVLDLGLSRLRLATPPQTDTFHSAGGTVDYMAPEQGQDRLGGDHRVDVYGLGCTLYYLLTGKPIYPGDTILARLAAHRDAPVPSLREARPDVPAGLDRVFQRMVAKRPQDRFQSIAEVIAVLKPFLPEERARRWRRGLLGVLLVTLLGLSGVLAWFAWHRPQEPDVVGTSKTDLLFDNRQDDIRAVAVSPDGRYVLSGSFNTNCARLWDSTTGKLIYTLAGHTK